MIHITAYALQLKVFGQGLAIALIVSDHLYMRITVAPEMFSTLPVAIQKY